MREATSDLDLKAIHATDLFELIRCLNTQFSVGENATLCCLHVSSRPSNLGRERLPGTSLHRWFKFRAQLEYAIEVPP